MKPAFIIGSPRSGTTILENILSCHAEIAEWYEPYYLWERFFTSTANDVWSPAELTPGVEKVIRKEFEKFTQKADQTVVLDKSPTHAFNIEIIHQIFPDAKWIHMLRDGRDVTLSINKEWQKREQMVRQRNYGRLFRVAWQMLGRQPFWRYKLEALLFEMKTNLSVNPRRYLNKSKWRGEPGWGPRFYGWDEYIKTHSYLQFNAMQWVKSVEAVLSSWPRLPEENRLEVRYEDLLTDPVTNISEIVKFLGQEPTEAFFQNIPSLKSGNFHKWKDELTPSEIAEIKPILSPLLETTGYLRSCPW